MDNFLVRGFGFSLIWVVWLISVCSDFGFGCLGACDGAFCDL